MEDNKRKTLDLSRILRRLQVGLVQILFAGSRENVCKPRHLEPPQSPALEMRATTLPTTLPEVSEAKAAKDWPGLHFARQSSNRASSEP